TPSGIRSGRAPARGARSAPSRRWPTWQCPLLPSDRNASESPRCWPAARGQAAPRSRACRSQHARTTERAAPTRGRATSRRRSRARRSRTRSALRHGRSRESRARESAAPLRRRSGATAPVPALQGSLHGHRAVLLLDGTEAVALVQTGAAALGAEADARVPFLARALEERVHELPAEPAAAPARNDRDRELGRLLVDEAEPGRGRRKDAVPGRADRPVLPGDEPGVARPAPVVHIARDGEVGIRVQPPVIRVLQHVAQEPN